MVRDYHFMLRCTPHEEEGFQRCMELNLRLLNGSRVASSLDCVGNRVHCGSFRVEHDLFVISMCGEVECGDYAIAEAAPNPVYALQSHYTHPDDSIKGLAAQVLEVSSPLELALGLSSMITLHLNYCAGATSVATLASEALALGSGVCQDYSHLLLSMCRSSGLYARYVMGYVMGEGETHAWVEVWSDGVWYGIDPTHNTIVKEGYIKVAHGRDAADCSVVRGMRRGVSNSESTVRVIVERIL